MQGQKPLWSPGAWQEYFSAAWLEARCPQVHISRACSGVARTPRPRTATTDFPFSDFILFNSSCIVHPVTIVQHWGSPYSFASEPADSQAPIPGDIGFQGRALRGATSLVCSCLAISTTKSNSSDFLHCRDQLWDLNSNDGSLTRPALDVQMKIGSVQHAQPFAHIAQPDAFHVDMRHFFFRDTHAVIFDFDAQTPVAVRCSQFDFPAAQLRREAMFQAILHHRLEQHAGHK